MTFDEEVKRYSQVIARNILSGRNQCGTLQHAVESGDESYFIRQSSPVVQILLEEKHGVQADRDAALGEAEAKRMAIETILANLYPTRDEGVFSIQMNASIRGILEKALGKAIIFSSQ